MSNRKIENNSETEEEGIGREYKSAFFFHSGAHMLLGTHPIPARSPAEREGQNGREIEEGRRRDGEENGDQYME